MALNEHVTTGAGMVSAWPSGAALLLSNIHEDGGLLGASDISCYHGAS